MDTPSGDAHTKIGGSLVMLTPTSQFTTDQLFTTPWMDGNGIADLVIIVNTYPVEGLYINDETLDVSTTLVSQLLSCFRFVVNNVSFNVLKPK